MTQLTEFGHHFGKFQPTTKFKTIELVSGEPISSNGVSTTVNNHLLTLTENSKPIVANRIYMLSGDNPIRGAFNVTGSCYLNNYRGGIDATIHMRGDGTSDHHASLGSGNGYVALQSESIIPILNNFDTGP